MTFHYPNMCHIVNDWVIICKTIQHCENWWIVHWKCRALQHIYEKKKSGHISHLWHIFGKQKIGGHDIIIATIRKSILNLFSWIAHRHHLVWNLKKSMLHEISQLPTKIKRGLPFKRYSQEIAVFWLTRGLHSSVYAFINFFSNPVSYCKEYGKNNWYCIADMATLSSRVRHQR